MTSPGVFDVAQYDVQVLDGSCLADNEGNYSSPLVVTTSIFGDVTGGFDPGATLWVAPENVVGIPTDILGLIAGFGNQPGNMTKIRADVEPCSLDFKINIIDIVRMLDGFRGLPYPFGPSVLDCPSDPCGGSAAGVAMGG